MCLVLLQELYLTAKLVFCYLILLILHRILPIMLTASYILNDIKPLQLDNTIADAKKRFKKTIFSHIPIVEDANLYGLLAESDLLGVSNTSVTIRSVQFMLHSFFTWEEMNWFELIKNFTINEANIVPVLDADKKYIGYYELQDVLRFFSNTPFLQEDGVTLVLSKNKTDFSISEVAQIVESADAKLLGVFVSKLANNSVEITLKLQSETVNDVLHSFRRYDYKIIKGIKEDVYLNDLKERASYLQKYLNI